MATSNPTDPGSPFPLRPALRETDSDDVRSPRCGPAKVVSIAENEEEIPPAPLTEEPVRPKLFTASTAGKRLTGRTTISNSSSRVSLRSQPSIDDLLLPEAAQLERKGPVQHHTHRHDRFVAQVTGWLEAERVKRLARKEKKKAKAGAKGQHHDAAQEEGSTGSKPRSGSHSSDSSTISLEKLQKILEDNMAIAGSEQAIDSSAMSTPRRPSYPQPLSKRKASLYKKLGLGSDTDKVDVEDEVDHVNSVLDNTKTMSYTGGADKTSDGKQVSSRRADQEKEAWSTFKLEILKLAHTLHVKGWRGIPFEISDKIEVSRLSGALTNAVYVVSPPAEEDMPPPEQQTRKHRKADKVLLRIYGPQADINRELELSILRRLAKQSIGPKMLGTFDNGRFEQFFNAQTLTPKDVRDPNTNRQIAKRMRELHDGVELLDNERKDGPFVWQNWDKWRQNAEKRVTYLDEEIKNGSEGRGESWRRRGLVLGVEWALFEATFKKHREWLEQRYEELGGLEDELVFAHNDTQYGNILRLVPESKDGAAPSPLLLPQNTHRQLIVIDFEYASANTRGQEFCNHFTEWCYDYTDEAKPWACGTHKYPSLDDQKLFIRSYLNHISPINPKPPTATPQPDTPAEPETITGASGVAGTINTVINDIAHLRNPLGNATPLELAEKEEQRKKEVEEQLERILTETRWWRIANSAQWILWGVSQAHIADFKDEQQESEEGAVEDDESISTATVTDAETAGEKEPADQEADNESEGGTTDEEEKEPEFDYLAYAQDRAMFFWGDVVTLGLVKKEDLPEKLREKIKIVDF